MTKIISAITTGKRISPQGIVKYFFAQQGSQIVFPAGADLYLFDFKTPLKRLTKNPSPKLDVQISPKDTYVSFVSDQNLYVSDLKGGREFAITRDGRDDIFLRTIADFFERRLLN